MRSPDVPTSGRPDVQTSRRPDIRTSGRPDIWTSGRPDVRTSRRPDSGRPDIRTSRRPDVRTSGRPDVQTSGRPVTCLRVRCTNKHTVTYVNNWLHLERFRINLQELAQCLEQSFGDVIFCFLGQNITYVFTLKTHT